MDDLSQNAVFVEVGRQIERCPVCDARVCRVLQVGGRGTWKLASLPGGPFSLDGQYCAVHACRGALSYLQNPPFPPKARGEETEVERIERCAALDLSSCCEAPIDYSQVIEKGRCKNHGQRLCSKCRRCLYHV